VINNHNFSPCSTALLSAGTKHRKGCALDTGFLKGYTAPLTLTIGKTPKDFTVFLIFARVFPVLE
jgi:hypothetical protein